MVSLADVFLQFGHYCEITNPHGLVGNKRSKRIAFFVFPVETAKKMLSASSEDVLVNMLF